MAVAVMFVLDVSSHPIMAQRGIRSEDSMSFEG